MKKIKLILLFIVVTKFVSSQTISPSELNEYCPLIETIFSVTIPGDLIKITTGGGCQVTKDPYNISTSGANIIFDFKGKFNDVNQPQTFTVSYTGGTKDFTFKKIKSLYYGHSGNIQFVQPTINVPLCQIINTSLTFTPVKWKTDFTNPTESFGAITTYEFLLPTGWSIGSSVSNGSNWIKGSNSITVTSDLSTGHNGVIRVRSINAPSCSVNNFYGNETFVTILRGSNITVSSSPSSIVCGTATPISFTINNTSSIPNITGYTWNLGSATNGWTYNGSAAPATISTATNNLILTPDCGAVLSSVTGTVISSCGTLNTIAFALPVTQPALTIDGIATLCTTAVYNILGGLPCNATVDWSISPSDIAIFNNTTGSSVTLNPLKNGTGTLTATIIACGVTTTITKQLTVQSRDISGSYRTFNASSQAYEYYSLVNGTSAYIPAIRNAAVYIYFDITQTNVTNVKWSYDGVNTVSTSKSFTAQFTAPSGGYSTLYKTVYLNANTPCGPFSNYYPLTIFSLGSPYFMNPSPNPVEESINLLITKKEDKNAGTASKEYKDWEASIASADKSTKFYLYDFYTSRLAKQWSFAENINNNYKLKIANVKAGAYLLKMVRDNTITTTKLIVR